MVLSCMTDNRCLGCGGGCVGYERTREEMAPARARYNKVMWGEAARELYLSLYAELGGRWDLVETKDVWYEKAREAASNVPKSTHTDRKP